MAIKAIKGSCPVCGHSTKSCQQSEETGMVFCRGAESAPGWSFRGKDRTGLWNRFVPDDKNDQARIKLIESQKASENIAKVVPHERSNGFSRVLSQLRLAQHHGKDLLKRGLTPNQIRNWKFGSVTRNQKLRHTDVLPGFQNDRYVSDTGYLVPIRDVNKRFVGCQVSVDGGKYKWLGSVKKADGFTYKHHNEFNETPLQVIDRDTDVIGLSEGTLKPVVASYIQGQTFIGASGGLFFSSIKTLAQTLQKLDATNKTIVYYPDANILKVSKAGKQEAFYIAKKSIQAIQNLGYEVLVGNWGQWSDASRGDIDEISKSTEINYIEASVFLTQGTEEEGYDVPKEVAEEFKKLKVATQNISKGKGELEVGSATGSKAELFEPGQRESVYVDAMQRGFKYVLDTSYCGSGKSWTVGNMHVGRFLPQPEGMQDERYDRTHKLVYLTTQSRNPNTVELEKRFFPLPVRHEGMYFDNNKHTPAGTPHIKRVDDGQEPTAAESNCHWTNKFTALREKNIDSKGICGLCPLKAQCLANADKATADYGYRKELIEALSHSHLRANPNSISSELIKTGDQWVGIVDEYSQCLDLSTEILVNKTTLKSTFSNLSQFNMQLFDKVNKLILQPLNDVFHTKSIKSRYGINKREVMAMFDIDAIADLRAGIMSYRDFQNAYEQDFVSKMNKDVDVASNMSTDWLFAFMQVLTKVESGSFHLNNQRLTIMLRNDYLVNCLNKFSFLVFQDATGSVEDLAAKLDIEPEAIYHCAERKPKTDNLEIVQIRGFGSASKDRSDSTNEKINVIKDILTTRHGDDLGIIDWKSKANAGELNHLSDARGSNAYKTKKAVLSVGRPCPALSALQIEYETYFNTTVKDINDPEFSLYVQHAIRGEIIQEVGRLRYSRRLEEELRYYLLCDGNFSFLEDMGYNVTKTTGLAFSEKAATDHQTSILDCYKAFESFRAKTGSLKIKASDIAKERKVSVSAVSQLVQGGWKHGLKPMLQDLDNAVKSVKKLISLANMTIDQVQQYCEENCPDLWYIVGEYIPELLREFIATQKNISTDEVTDLDIESLEEVPQHIMDDVEACLEGFEEHKHVFINSMPVPIYRKLLDKLLDARTKRAIWRADEEYDRMLENIYNQRNGIPIRTEIQETLE